MQRCFSVEEVMHQLFKLEPKFLIFCKYVDVKGIDPYYVLYLQDDEYNEDLFEIVVGDKLVLKEDDSERSFRKISLLVDYIERNDPR